MAATPTNPTGILTSLIAAIRDTWARKENVWALLIAVASAYLSLFNLGYAPLWDDEPHMASIARNILDNGEYTTWDGRNLIGAHDGRAVDQDLNAISYPPWQATSTLLGIVLFGHNETGVRFFHTLLGVASLFAFWQLLRLDFASRPRLRVIAFALFALSAQSILFFRQGRYAADAIFFSLALIYAYRLYIGPSGKPWHLACATAFAVLGFFNQFFIGITTLLSLAIWHMMFHWRATTRHQWISLIVAGTVFTTVCLGYLWLAGILENRQNLDLGDMVYEYTWPKRGFVLAYLHFRDIVRFNWIPFWIAIWLLGWLGWIALARPKPAQEGTKRKSWRAYLPTPEPQDLALARYLVLFVLLLLFTGFVNVQSTLTHALANTRYLVAALPFSFLLVAICVDWLWRRFGALPGLALLAPLMLSNLVGYPFLHREPHLTLSALVYEIHQPLRNSAVEVNEYLRTHAKQDELIWVEPWQSRDILIFYLGDKLLFCCMLDKETTPLPPETVLSMSERLYLDAANPDWFVSFTPRLTVNPDVYELSFIGKTRDYASTHRPELEWRSFQSVPAKYSQRAYVYKKKSL